MAVAVCTWSATSAAGAAEPRVEQLLLLWAPWAPLLDQQIGATSRGHSGIGGARVEVEARQPLDERE